MITSEKVAEKYNTAILNLFEIILSLDESQQRSLLKLAEYLFIKEKRTNVRKSCHIPIYYATSDRVYTTHIQNISPNGLFILTQKILPIGDEILMTFRMEGLNKPIKTKGEITHTNRWGMGVKFKGIKPQIAGKLEFLVDRMKE
ncbi:MAG: PilZ domain-containing protein [Desulfobacterales bacterium]|jgi:Tfp pilus assembly protein PilZ|nr:MAG: PilZ domain-containing protein [Desulfobacterales bacterium]